MRKQGAHDVADLGLASSNQRNGLEPRSTSTALTSEIRYFGTLQANLLTGDDPSPQVDRIKMRMAGYQLEGDLAPLRRRCSPRRRQCLSASFHLRWRIEAPHHAAARISGRIPRELCEGSRFVFFNKQSLNLSSQGSPAPRILARLATAPTCSACLSPPSRE